MSFARRLLPVLCLAFLFSGLNSHGKTALPSTPVQTAPSSTTVPAQPATAQAYSLPPAKLVKAIALGRIRHSLGLASSLWELFLLWLLLATRWAAGLAAWAERLSRRRWLQGLLFFAAVLIVTALAELPLEAIGHAVSRHYGVSVQGWCSWFDDLAKGLGVSVLFGAPILLFFNWIASVSPRRYWIFSWLVALTLMILSVLGEPLLEPIFNHFEPLAKNHSALVDRLESLVARTGTRIPPDRMFLMKASEKSNGLNAYVAGLGSTKRIVVWDTTVGRIPDDEILFIFGHESGHYVLHHISKMIAGAAIALFFVFWASASLAGWLARRFGSRWQLDGLEDGQTPLASRQGFLVLLFVLSAASFILQPVGNTFSRHFEHEADVYGQEAIHGLVADPQKTVVSAFNHLGEAWLEDPNPNPIIEFWVYSHPSIQHRASFAAHYDPWANGGHGSFFDK
jgi:Zn-dependent protease with chaperone function